MKTNEAQDMNRRFINARLSLKRVNKLVSELKAARSQKDVTTSIGDLFRALCKAGFNKKKIVCGVIKCIAMKRDFKKHLYDGVARQQQLLPEIVKYFGDIRYEELHFKF